jgi:ATP-dependent DNA helicase PIF1
MCVANLDLDRGICNGTTGVITHFTPVQNLPCVTLKNGEEYVFNYHAIESEKYPGFAVKQVPLILAWAVTIHKSQGATLEMAEMDIGSSIFTTGQTYVALSRVKSIDGLYLKSFDYKKIVADEEVKEFYEKFYETDEETDEEDEEEEKMEIPDISGCGPS